jgi:hypothetical protein
MCDGVGKHAAILYRVRFVFARTYECFAGVRPRADSLSASRRAGVARLALAISVSPRTRNGAVPCQVRNSPNNGRSVRCALSIGFRRTRLGSRPGACRRPLLPGSASRPPSFRLEADAGSTSKSAVVPAPAREGLWPAGSKEQHDEQRQREDRPPSVSGPKPQCGGAAARARQWRMPDRSFGMATGLGDRRHRARIREIRFVTRFSSRGDGRSLKRFPSRYGSLVATWVGRRFSCDSYLARKNISMLENNFF